MAPAGATAAAAAARAEKPEVIYIDCYDDADEVRTVDESADVVNLVDEANDDEADGNEPDGDDRRPRIKTEDDDCITLDE